MKYDARACHFNMDTGCVELLLRDGRMISIDCTGVEDELDVTMAQRLELDYLIYNDPLGYADLILNGEPEEYVARQFFCETRTEFLRKNSQVLRSKSETRSLASTAPKMEGAVHVKGRVLAWGGAAFAAPPLAFCPWGSSYPSVASPASSAASWAATGSVYSDQP